MPKLPNAKKIASRSIRQESALDSALAGKYEIAQVEKSLGRSQFRVLLGKEARTVSITSAVLRCGPNGGSYITAGCYVIVEAAEVVGVVSVGSKGFKALRKAGRIPEERAVESEDFFEAADGQKEDIWARTDAAREERLALADELAARYRKRNAGQASKSREVSAGEVALVAEVEEAEESDEEVLLEEAPAAAPSTPERKSGPNRAERRALALAAAAQAEEAVDLSAIYRAAQDEEEVERALAKARAEFANRQVADNWEEEIDIDAI
jgi:hypothetical protein